MPGPVISRSRTITAPPQRVFDLLADPRAHARFDGSGTVRSARSGPAQSDPARLSLGARFAMDMKIVVPYRITNEVVEFDDGRRIAWRHLGGHIWRYELEPVDGGAATKVTETFDGRPARSALLLRLMGVERKHPQAMESTLERLDQAATVA